MLIITINVSDLNNLIKRQENVKVDKKKQDLAVVGLWRHGIAQEEADEEAKGVEEKTLIDVRSTQEVLEEDSSHYLIPNLKK